MTVYTAVIEHMSGMEIHTSTTPEGLDKKVAAYCRSYWDTIDWNVDGVRPPAPVDDRATISRYFEDHENDSLTVEASECEGALPSEAAILDAILLAEFVHSLEASFDAAGGHCKWDNIKHETLESLAPICARNGVLFTARSSDECRRIHAMHRASARVVTAARPYLK